MLKYINDEFTLASTQNKSNSCNDLGLQANGLESKLLLGAATWPRALNHGENKLIKDQRTDGTPVSNLDSSHL